MKNLKLEVGKTYLNGKGERVKIVANNGHEMFPFEGDDYQSYTLDGHWMPGYNLAFDLIDYAPIAQPEKRTFKIPENTREISVSETDGRIIIEFVPGVPELTEPERIRAFFRERRWGIDESLVSTIEQYIKEREEQI